RAGGGGRPWPPPAANSVPGRAVLASRNTPPTVAGDPDWAQETPLSVDFCTSVPAARKRPERTGLAATTRRYSPAAAEYARVQEAPRSTLRKTLAWPRVSKPTPRTAPESAALAASDVNARPGAVSSMDHLAAPSVLLKTPSVVEA